jgi:hypothetical protein
MSSVTDPQPDPLVDEIVAYLDGELPPDDCRRVENRLATDEEYRRELHELDRAWEALDALPNSTVDEGFARTTIELACVAAEADLSDYTAGAKVAKRSRMLQWVGAGTAALVIGLLVGRTLVPDRNRQLLADLPAIQQFNVLPYVEDVEFLRQLSAVVPAERMIKDQAAFDRHVTDLESTNSPALETRREWVESLPPERKAELADRARAFADLLPAPDEQQRMRQIMQDIRDDDNRAKLQETLVAYGQWLSRHTAGQQEQVRAELVQSSMDEQVELVKERVERNDEPAFEHLTTEDADKLRREIIQIAAKKKPELMERMRHSRQPGRALNAEEKWSRQATLMALVESFRGNSRERTERQLIGALSPAAQAHWESLGRSQREFGRARQLWMWIQDAMNLKADPKKLEEFFASDKLQPDEKQRLLNQPRAEMDAALERMYIRSELGIDNPAQFLGDGAGPGRPRGPVIIGPPRDGDGPRRPPVFGPGQERRPPPPAPKQEPI